MALTAQQRVKNQRKVRLAAGWEEVRVWVRTKEDAQQVRELAAKLRENAQDIQSLKQLEGVIQMDAQIRERVLSAIEKPVVNQSPYSAFLELLTELAKTGSLADMSEAFNLFVNAHPGNAKRVSRSINAIILKHFLIPSLWAQRPGAVFALGKVTSRLGNNA